MNFKQREFFKFIGELFLIFVLSFALIMHLIRWGAGGAGLSPAYSKMMRSHDERADDAWVQMNAFREGLGHSLRNGSQYCPDSIRTGCVYFANGASLFMGIYE
jgi:hypothetical protein